MFEAPVISEFNAKDFGYSRSVPIFSFIVLIVMNQDMSTLVGSAGTCKFWLDTVALSANNGFPPQELNLIRKTILNHLNHILEAWDEHCGE